MKIGIISTKIKVSVKNENKRSNEKYLIEFRIMVIPNVYKMSRIAGLLKVRNK